MNLWLLVFHCSAQLTTFFWRDASFFFTLRVFSSSQCITKRDTGESSCIETDFNISFEPATQLLRRWLDVDHDLRNQRQLDVNKEEVKERYFDRFSSQSRLKGLFHLVQIEVVTDELVQM